MAAGHTEITTLTEEGSVTFSVTLPTVIPAEDTGIIVMTIASVLPEEFTLIFHDFTSLNYASGL